MRPGIGTKLKKIIAGAGLICLSLMMSMQPVLASSVPSDMSDIPAPAGMSLDYAKNGIVRITAGTTDEEGEFHLKNSCSGFIAGIDNGNVYVVTTLHSVDYGDEGTINVTVKNDHSVPATVEAPNREKDFCILSVENEFNDKNAIPLRSASYDGDENALSAGDAVSALGFITDDKSTEYSAADVDAKEGKLVKTAAENSGYIAHDIDIGGDMCGGVLVDEDGYAIGLINTEKEGALDISEVDDLLDKEGIQHRTKDKDLMYSELYDDCVEAETLVKRARSETKQELRRVWSEGTEVLKSEPYNRDALSAALADYNDVIEHAKYKTPVTLILIMALGALIVFLAFRLWSLIRWNKAHAGGSPAAAPGTERTKDKKPAGKVTGRKKRSRQQLQARLTVMSSGAVYEVTGDIFTIGRSEDSDLVIAGNNMVGRKHAYIERRPEAFYLFDAGSRNGTFLNDMRADANGIRLVSGDIIRLANEEIQFIQY